MRTETSTPLARCIEHTLLAPEATAADVDRLCEEAIRYGFHGVCVNPIHVRRAVDLLAATAAGPALARRPVVVTVVGFPLGACRTETKADAAWRAMDDGADEIDMVPPLGALLEGDAATVRSDIEAVSRVVHGGAVSGACPRLRSGVLKVILETASMDDSRIVLGCRCSAEGEADFVKTSTGFHASGGARIEHVRLLHRIAAPLGVKASGGIRTADVARAMLEAGASRIGTSAGPAIVDQAMAGPAR
jgi:deoxyribose-phosphate aldolase